MSDIGLPPQAPPVPSRRNDQQVEFDIKTDAYLGWQETFRAWLASFRDWVISVRTTTLDARDVAIAAATASATAADAAAGAANFVGLWSGLAGQLSKPATVKNGGRFWLLLQDLADVTAHEPAEGPYWTALDAGQGVTQVITTAGASVNAMAGVCYVLANTGITLVYPSAGQMRRDYIGVVLAAPPGTQVIDFNGNKFRGQLAGERLINIDAFALDTYYEDATQGYI